MPRGNVLAWIKIENNFSKSRLKLNFALFFSLTVILKSNKCSKLYKTDHLHLVPKIIFLAIIRNLPSFKLRKNKQKPEDYFLFFHICSHISLEYIHYGLLSVSQEKNVETSDTQKSLMSQLEYPWYATIFIPLYFLCFIL